MRMPGMDGAMLLARIKEEHPATVRIILSGHADRDAVLAATQSAHQILSKPCDAEKLRSVLLRACRIHELLSDPSMRECLGRIESLPSLPQAYWELMGVLSDINFSMQRIAEIVESDSAMCSKVLQIVNSPCFSVASDITSVERAVCYLGADMIRSLALSVHVFRALENVASCPESSLQSVQAHALLTARVVDALFGARFGDAFTAALLHDVGCTVLACGYPERFSQALETSHATGRPACEVEEEILGLNHATAGAYLLGLWGVPDALTDVVASHHSPANKDQERFGVSSAVAVADALVHNQDGGPEDLPADLLHHLEKLGVVSNLKNWRESASRQIELSAREHQR
jgi:HD-like signal output (HDOD) protein